MGFVGRVRAVLFIGIGLTSVIFALVDLGFQLANLLSTDSWHFVTMAEYLSRTMPPNDGLRILNWRVFDTPASLWFGLFGLLLVGNGLRIWPMVLPAQHDAKA